MPLETWTKDKKKNVVLVVEDYPDMREMMRVLLQIGGYEVIEAEDGIRAVELARSEHPDLILMDMCLPTMDGYQATKLIRQQPETMGIPIIACTANNRWEWRAKAIAAGCNDFLTKPFDLGTLKKSIARYLEPVERQKTH